MAVSHTSFGAGAAVVVAILFGLGVSAARSDGLAVAAPSRPVRANSAPGVRFVQAAATTVPVPTTVTAAGITMHSISIDLPTSKHVFPGSAAADPVSANCVACHSAGMVLTQPKLSAAGWKDEVNKMRLTYKAPIDEPDVPAIVAYLAALTTVK